MYEVHARQAVEQAIGAREMRRLESRRGVLNAIHRTATGNMRSDTTIAAFHYREGVLCVADRKISTGDGDIMSQDYVKMNQISSHSIMLGSGFVSDMQLAIRTLQNVVHEFQQENGDSLSVAGQAYYLANLFRIWGEAFEDGFLASMILVGFDKKRGPSIFLIHPGGAYYNRSEFATSGSGGVRIEDQLDARWKPRLTRAEALDVAMHGLIHSGMRDSATSPPLIALPTVACVTHSGVEMLGERVIERALGRALLTKRDVRKSFAKALIGGKE